MGTKVETNPLENLENEISAVQSINSNDDLLADAFDNTISRDGTAPNYMLANLDVNGYRVINVGAPAGATDAARWADVQSSLTLTEYAVPSLTGNSGKTLKTDGLTIFWSTAGIGDLVSTNNLSDLNSVTTARNNLGLGTAAVATTGTSGATVPFLNGNNTFSGTNAFSGALSLTGGATLGGAVDYRLQSTPTSLNSDSIGYRGAPQNIQDANYSFTLLDSGKGVTHTSGSAHAWTIEPDATVNHPIHTCIVLDNYGAGAVTVTRGAGVTLRTNGSGTSADQTLSQYFVKSLYKIGANYWVLL